jgi:hypothetical protein
MRRFGRGDGDPYGIDRQLSAREGVPLFDCNRSQALLPLREKDIRGQIEAGTQSLHLRQSELPLS